MSARKKRPVMYEVIGRGRRARSRPAARRATPPRTPAPPPPQAAEAPAPQPSAPPPPPPPRPRRSADTPVRATSLSGGEPLARYSEGRLHLALSWPYLAVAGVVLIAIVVGMYAAGRRSALPPEPQTLEQTGLASENRVETPPETAAPPIDPWNRPSREEVSTPQTPTAENTARAPATPPRPEAPPREPETVLEPGHYYVLVQYFRKSDPDHARAAAEFLRANGVPCVVVEAERDLRLYVTTPFDSTDATGPIRARIKQLGEEYARQGGGYSFDQPQIHKK